MEQLDLYELIDLFNGDYQASSNVAPTIVHQEMNDNLESYLKKGEKINSLLKEKQKSKKFKKSHFLDCINYMVYAKRSGYKRTGYILSCIRDKMIRPALDECQDENGVFKSFAPFIELFQEFGERIVCSIEPSSSYPSSVMNTFFRNNESSSYTFVIEVKNKELDSSLQMYAPFSSSNRLKASQSGQKWTMRRMKKYITCVDPGLFFAQIVFYFQLRKRAQDILCKLSNEEKLDNKVYCMLLDEQFKRLNENCTNGMIYIKKELLSQEYIREFLQSYHIPYKAITKEEEKVYAFEKELKILNVTHFAPTFFLSDSVSKEDWFFQSSYQRSGSSLTSDLSGGTDNCFMIKLFELLSEEYLEDKREEEFRKAMESDYALSYQTKKNIPTKCIEAMKSSKFNDYFGYVEFDEECDLTKIKELEKEFSALVTYMHWVKKDDVSLRFRKLGNHNAAGLYYPHFKNICVDVRYPHSMAHEYFHMLDYENGSVSRGQKFEKVLSIYRNELVGYINSLKDGNGMKEQFNGKTKYNKSYYFQPTEVFARCGEMYLVRHKGVDNSLVKPESGLGYPDSEELMKAIIEYFDTFFDIKENYQVNVVNY